MNWKFNASVT